MESCPNREQMCLPLIRCIALGAVEATVNSRPAWNQQIDLGGLDAVMLAALFA